MSFLIKKKKKKNVKVQYDSPSFINNLKIILQELISHGIFYVFLLLQEKDKILSEFLPFLLVEREKLFNVKREIFMKKLKRLQER